MGVTQLWQILAPVEQHLTLSSLAGQTLAVDLSIWVCENQCVKQMQGVVSKPYLRNLFFRISHLTQLGVKLVFVIEGSAPELKWDTMIKRQQSRFPGRQGKQAPQRPAGKQTRKNFNSWLKECCELLEILGIPYIQSKGEAEALCALLNASGLVDGCLTNDGDAFLYGATTVYRNFTMNTKDPHVEMYKLSDIQTKLGIDRGGLIALGLLIGCDFVPKGVPGIGIANAVRLLQSLQGQDVLLRLQTWSTMSERDCVDQAEILARRKAIQLPDFPQIKVIDEFLVAKDRCPSRLPEWKRPVPAKLQDFAQIKLEWPVEYTIEKILPLITLWDMQDLTQSKNPSVHQHLKPHRIVKTRIRQGEPCFEVEWIKPVTDTVNDGSYYVTIETQELFSRCYPDVVTAFFTQSAETKKKPKAKKKKKKVEASPSEPLSLDSLSFQFEKVNLGRVASQLQESVKDLHPSFSEYDETTLTTKAKQPRHLTLSPNSKKSVVKGDSSESRKLLEDRVIKSGRDTEDSSFVPLSQRVKMRIQSKHGSNKENEDKQEKVAKRVLNDPKLTLIKSPNADLSNMSSLLEDIQNLSLKEAENFRHKTKDKVAQSSFCKLNCNSSPDVVSWKQRTPSNISARQMGTFKEIQKMSSPSTEAICSPMTYIKHQGNLGDSFEIQRSPYYIENPFAAAKTKPEKNVIDFASPGFFSRPDPKNVPEEVDDRCAAKKLIEKIENGINNVGAIDRIGTDKVPSSQRKAFLRNEQDGEKLTVDSLMSILNGSNSGKSLDSSKQEGKQRRASQGNGSVTGIENSIGQFGDFQIQHSLLNSLCSSLVQALTPKGVSMTKDEYDRLLNTLNEIDSDEDDGLDRNGVTENITVPDEVACNIDFSELEKASSGLKNLNQKLLLKPIQIDDEDVMSKLSKSARKKLRRRERRREQELENLAQNNSQCKEKIKCSVSGQQTQKNSLKTTGSKTGASFRVNDLNKKAEKRKRTNENSFHNLLQTNSARETNSEIKCSSKTKVIESENSFGVNVLTSSQSRNTEITKVENQSENKLGGNDNKLKKKKKKKKVKKASPLIDISADHSILEGERVGSCAGYLKKALEINQRKLASKIIKASPIMDVSADDTLLELEGLSCKVTGEVFDLKLETKLKKKKRLSKEKMSKECGASQTNTVQTEPVLSIDSRMTDKEDCDNSQVCECEGKSTLVTDGNKVAVESTKDNEVIAAIKLEEEVKEEIVVEKLCSVHSPAPTHHSNGKLNMLINKKNTANNTNTGDASERDNQENESAANLSVRELEYPENTRNSVLETTEVFETEQDLNVTTHHTPVSIAMSTEQEDTSEQGLQKGKDNIKIIDSSVEGQIQNDARCPENGLEGEVVDFLKDHQGLEQIAVVNDLETLNAYHMKPCDASYRNEDKHTSYMSEGEKMSEIRHDVLLNEIDCSNGIVENDENFIITVGEKNRGKVIVKGGNDTSRHETVKELANGITENENTEKIVCKSAGQYCGSEGSPKRMSGKIDLNEMDISVSGETNGVHTCNYDIDEDNGDCVMKMKCDLNGKVITRILNLDSSEEKTVKVNFNGNGCLDKTSEMETEIFSEKSSGDIDAGNRNIIEPEVFQSPACLADRLKLKLRKTSTRNVLDTFTNGK